MNTLFYVLALLLAGLSVPQAAGGGPDPAAIRADIALQERAVAEAAADVERFGEGSALWSLASLRNQLSAINLEALKARLAVLDGGEAVAAVTIPVAPPDPRLLEKLIAQIADQERRIEEAEAEAAGLGGLLQALAASRAMAEKVTLALMRAAYFRAAYGVAWPEMHATTLSDKPPPGDPSPARPVAGPDGADAALGDGPFADPATPAWADPDHPEINYADRRFALAALPDHEVRGWWILGRSQSPVDDSPQLVAMNISAASPSPREAGRLIVQCRERELSVVFLVDEFVFSDHRRVGHDVLIRIDGAPARTELWNELVGNRGAGIFGAQRALPLMRGLAAGEKVFLRINPSRGASVDETFALAGAADVMERVAATCGETLIALAPEDYRAVQELLIAGGYLRAPADGVWGPASRAAMAAYQRAEALAETGAPDRATLARMGLR